MGELKYHMVRSDDTFLSSEIKIMMEIGAFTKYIRDNSIENVFVSEFSGEFVKLKDKSPSFNDSIIFFAFDCNKIMMLWTDSLGFSSIEDYEESIKNQIFTMIIYFKQQYPDLEQWQDSIGTIYEHLRLVGYKESDDVKDSVEFFQGYLFSYLEYKKVRDYGKDHCFNNITEMINSQRGGFENCEDYNEAEYLKTPNIQTLRSMRLTMELEHNFHFVDYTSSLLFAVMLKIRRRLKDPEKGELKSKLSDIRRVINFERSEGGKYRFFARNDKKEEIELKKLFEVNEDKFDKYERVTSLKSIGTWPYPDKCDYFEILTFLGEQFKA